MKKEISFRKIVSLVALLMLALLVAVTSTFSWYPRTGSTTTETQKLRYVKGGYVAGVGAKTVTTYAGTNDNGTITYSETALGADEAVAVNDEKIYYFKTVVTETGNGGDAAISLYIDKITASGSSIEIGLVKPEKTYNSSVKLTSGAVSDYCLEDNIIVANQSTVEIYWFIKYTGTTALSLGDFYYTNN